MRTTGRAGILKSSVSERLPLIEDVWESNADAPEGVFHSEAKEHE